MRRIQIILSFIDVINESYRNVSSTSIQSQLTYAKSFRIIGFRNLSVKRHWVGWSILTFFLFIYSVLCPNMNRLSNVVSIYDHIRYERCGLWSLAHVEVWTICVWPSLNLLCMWFWHKILIKWRRYDVQSPVSIVAYSTQLVRHMCACAVALHASTRGQKVEIFKHDEKGRREESWQNKLFK